jgi:signal transduction histidine kinase
MKVFYCIFTFIFLSFDNCFSQDSSAYVFHLNRLPPEGVLLDKGWKFQPGDNPDYAKPDYDDSKWQTINPTLDIHDSLPQIPKSGIIWLRLHFLPDSTIDNQLVMMIQQSGASEIYLNGKLIHRFGKLSIDSNKVKAFNPLEKPVSFPLNNTAQQVLAVRYALQPNISYTTLFGGKNKALNIIVNTTENSISQYYQLHTRDDENEIFKVGVFLILAILYLAFYLFYPAQKVNLYFSLYAFLTGSFWPLLVYYNNLNQIELRFPLISVALIAGVIASLILLAAIYRLLDQKLSSIYYCLLALQIINIFSSIYIYGWGWLVFAFLTSNLINFDIIRIALIAVRRNKKGAWIIAAGGMVFFISWLLFSFQWLGVIPNIVFFASLDLFGLSQLSIPIAVSIYLGYDFAFTNRSLQQKLAEVEKLSKENLEMEKKKQAAQIEAMVATQEQERKRISRDLHDDVGTKLSALNLFLSSLDEKAKCANNNEIRSLAQSSKQFIKEAMYDVRQLLLNLSPTILEEFGYTTAVEGLVNKINETKQIHFDLVVFGINHRFKKDYELALYRITQELINNVLKHAEAKNVSLQVGQRDEKIILMMEDDGIGFDVNAHKDGYGLNNLEARTKLMQGIMTIDSQPSKGTSVLIEVPFSFNGV